MSIQAVAWALEQDFSYTTPNGRQTSAHGAKLVLISLCNHADHTSGHCWPSAELIAKEASCSVRSVYRLIAALKRNGYIDVKKTRRPTGQQRSNNYWILFDRKPGPWQYYAGDDGPDEGDDPGDTVAHDTVSPGENESETPSVSLGPSAIRVTPQDSLEPSVLEPSAPRGFDARARAEEQAKLQAAEEARKAERIFVFEGSEPWKAWQKAKAPYRFPVHTRKEDGKRGWWFPSLYPKATGPPDSLMSPEDEQELAKKWG